MEWMVTNCQLQSTFSLLGSRIGDTYRVSDSCQDSLKEILNKLLNEDRVHRKYRRAIGFSQLIKKDLLPLLCTIKEDFIIMDLVVRILGNLTAPVECLLDVDSLLKSDTGRTIIYEINWLLTSCKEAFLDARTTRAILDYVKRILDKDKTLSCSECESINNCLLLVRNILHIPEVRGGVPGNGVSHQNQIIWNLFTQNMDKVLIQLMTGETKAQWVVVVVQLIALMYKDQHVGTLQKLLNLWFEASVSESSEDNESNTSPPEQCSGDSSSSMMMSDPTSDSSDNGGSRHQHKMSKTEGTDNKSSSTCSSSINNNNNNNINNADNKQGHNNRSSNHKNQPTVRKHFISNKTQGKKEKMSETCEAKHFDTKSHHSMVSWTSSEVSTNNSGSCTNNVKAKKECASSEVSDCGYGTQIENRESISTSSNEEDGPNPKPIHQKPSHLIQKSRYPSGKSAPMLANEKGEWRRKKLIKRSKTNIMNMKALLHHSPSDEDVSHLLKEFTVDFLLKGYAHLVQGLRIQLLTSLQPHIDTSHFFWLVTYFLKFAAQLELDLEHVSPVLSFDVVTYLTYLGVDLCEKLELIKVEGHMDLTPCLRRMHLVVTALREVIQAVEMYKKMSHLSDEDENHLMELQNKMCSTEDLKQLFVLLIRQFDPSIQSKQYLQDLIVANHLFLIFLENSNTVFHLSQSRWKRVTMSDHINQFASGDVMKKYGILLECFEENGEFVNNCVFTMMHHIAGDVNQADTLFQPCILRTFFKILESDFQICDDWSDLIEYIVHKFLNMKQNLSTERMVAQNNGSCLEKFTDSGGNFQNTRYSEQDDCSKMCANKIKSEKSWDSISTVLERYTESRHLNKTNNNVVIEQLMNQEGISDSQNDANVKKNPSDDNNGDKLEKFDDTKNDDKIIDDIKLLRDHLVNINKSSVVTWLQQSLLEVCYAKLYLSGDQSYVVEPIAYYHSLLNQSIPLVPWTSEQSEILHYQPFVLLLHKLGLHLSCDTGKMYPRIPNFWTPEILYSVAQKMGCLNSDELKFDALDLQISKSSLWLTDLDPASGKPPDTLFNITCTKRTSSFIGFTPGPNLDREWMEIVQLSKKTPESPSLQEDTELSCVIRDTDLTQMCVSDEEPIGSSESAK